jgi:ribosomal protein S18 acetylase RimI-like enzyme
VRAVVTRTGPGLVAPEDVAELYAAASAPPPLREPPAVAAGFADLYAWLRGRPDLVTAETWDQAGLAGFAYGHPWWWAEQDDAWSLQLRERLGTAAARLDGRLAVYLLAVHPRAGRRGLGRRLLREVVAAGGASGAWLQTRDEDTPAAALYRAEGWTPLGHGPDAPDGRPGLVLVRDA